MRALVTGAGGFVGANLVRFWAHRGVEVHGTVRPHSDRWRLDGSSGVVHEIDLGVPAATMALVRELRPDVIVHAAAHGNSSWHTSIEEMTRVNIVATNALVEAAKATGVGYFVGLGSSSEYGLAAHATVETDRLSPNSLYATTKAAGTHVLSDAIRSERLRGIVLRLYSVYGPYEDRRRLMPVVAWWAAQGALPPSLVSPMIARDFVHVADVCRAIDSCVDRRAAPTDPPVVNIGSGIQTTLADVLNTVRHEFAISDDPTWNTMDARLWDTQSWRADISRAREQLTWSPSITLADGIRDLAQFVVARPDRYRPDETDNV